MWIGGGGGPGTCPPKPPQCLPLPRPYHLETVYLSPREKFRTGDQRPAGPQQPNVYLEPKWLRCSLG